MVSVSYVRPLEMVLTEVYFRITSNARFSERLLRASETSTQQPSGFTQVMVAKILETWGMDGWVRWLRGLRAQYQERRGEFADLSAMQGLNILFIQTSLWTHSSKASRSRRFDRSVFFQAPQHLDQ
jgi:hypothetical protein